MKDSLIQKFLNASKVMFVKGVCMTYHPKHKDEGFKLAERAWEATYKEEALKLIRAEQYQVASTDPDLLPPIEGPKSTLPPLTPEDIEKAFI